jgi:hypothetical protein
MVAPNGWNLDATGQTLQSSLTVMLYKQLLFVYSYIWLCFIFFLGKKETKDDFNAN